MAAHNFAAVMREVFRHEGVDADHPADPGGRTRYGISQRAYPHLHIPSLTKADALAIYRRDYWDRVGGDLLPAGVDLSTTDSGINSGVSRGAKWLQGAVGAGRDGRVGPRTLEAVRRADPVATIQRACAARLRFMRGLRTWRTFKRGWSRRVAEVEAVGVRMAGASAERMRREAERARTRSATQAGGGVTATGGGAVPALTSPDAATIAILAVAVLVGVVLAVRAADDGERARAYDREAG